MNEATKSKAYWGPLENDILSGKGIDIGCGPDPVTPQAHRFDKSDGDANCITRYVHDSYDYVFSSHCLEHMDNPQHAIREWWQLVKPGGYLFFIVPDEDLYEQGVFPSRFNPDHKATFTISKTQSWSPRSFNVLDLANSLPHATIVKIALEDRGYNRCLYMNEQYAYTFTAKVANKLLSMLVYIGLDHRAHERFLRCYFPIDQTAKQGAQAQISCILQKQP